MKKNSQTYPDKVAEKPTSFPRKAILLFVIITALMPLILFLISGDWGWKQAWVIYALHLIFSYSGRLIAWKRNPDLLTERGRHAEHKDTMPGDQKLVTWSALIVPFITWIVAALEHRFIQPPLVQDWITWVAAVVLVSGYLIGNWAFVVNRFFSAVVRLQSERGQVVVSNGPYAIVRHPGYAGGILAYIAWPLTLGSLFAVIPTLVNIILVVIRTGREDQYLQEKLDGYLEYAKKVRYRLLPWVW